MRIVQRDGKWYCTEVYTAEPLGYGTYRFILASRVDQLDRNAVLGLFTWDDNAPQYNYREIDIEFSRWGVEGNDNSQFVVQPWDTPGNRFRFDTQLQSDYSTHLFRWEWDRVGFSSFLGSAPSPDPADEIATWEYAGGDVPPAGEESTRINLWLYGGSPPSDGQPVEVIIESFEYSFDSVRINFQPYGSIPPGGFMPDSSGPYLSALNYGWR